MKEFKRAREIKRDGREGIAPCPPGEWREIPPRIETST